MRFEKFLTKAILLSLICFFSGATLAFGAKPFKPYEFEISTWELREAGTKKWLQNIEFSEDYFFKYYSLLTANKSTQTISRDEVINYFNSRTWEFRSVFDYENFREHYPFVLLTLNRVTTFCELRVNAKKIQFFKNAFLAYEVDISPYLKKGKNEILLRFYPSHHYALQNLLSKAFVFPADNQSTKEKTAPYIRQPQCDFGWDFTRASHFFGLRSPATLKMWNTIRISQLHTRTLELQKEQAKIIVQYELESSAADQIDLAIEIKKDTSIHTITKQVTIAKGKTTYSDTLILKHPELWYPRGLFHASNSILSKPNLYRLQLTAKSVSVNYYDEKEIAFGLRKVKLIQNKDAFGESFSIEVNDIPVYAKGYNVSNAPSEDLLYRGNFNCLRVWGGGDYLSDDFYALADELGIMIWQDFMFSGSYYPADDFFLENVREEMRYQIQRLEQHPSLVLWCGNNEIDVASKNWGWEKTYSYSTVQQEKFKKDYEKLFLQCIPELLQQQHSKLPYLHSSPLSNWGKEEDFDKGDNHFWALWHGEKSSDVVEKHIPRFTSELGFPSLPLSVNLQLDGKEIGEALRDLLKEMVLSYKGPTLLERYITEEFKRPQSLAEWIYLSQVTQAKILKKAILAQRMSKRSSGTLLWQLQGGKEVIDWSVVDYDHGPKPAFYSSEFYFEPLLPVFKIHGDTVRITLLNDYVNAVGSVLLTYKIIDKSGKVYYLKQQNILVSENFEMATTEFYLSAIKNLPPKNECILVYELQVLSTSKKLRGYELFVKEKDFAFDKASITLTETFDKNSLLLECNTFAPYVKLTLDNYTLPFLANCTFLIPGERIEVDLDYSTCPSSLPAITKTKVECLNDYLRGN